MKRMTLLALAASSLIGIGSSAFAVPAVVVTEAPPPPRAESAPAPRAGRVWVEGHYRWRDGQYAWVQGHWQNARRGMTWEQAHWQQRPNGEWVFVEGHWRRGGGHGNQYGWNRRDNDGDGVINRMDRYPNNPRRS